MVQATMAGAPAPRIPGPIGMVALLFCGHFAIIGLFSIGVDLPRIANAFSDVPHARLLAEIAGCVTGLSFALSAPLVGRLIERYGYRRVYIWSLIGFVTAGTLPALLDNLYLIILCRLLFGLPVAASTTAAMSGLASLPDGIRARMFGRSAVVSSVGTILIFPITGALSSIGWRMGFAPCLFALALLPFVLLLPKDDAVPVTVHERAPGSRGRLGISPGLLTITAFVGLMMFVGPMFAPFYLAAIGITDPKLASLPLSAMSFASLVTTSLFGRLHARFGTAALFGCILFLTGFGLTWAGLSVSLWLFTGGLVTASLGLSLFKPNLGEAISAAAEGSPARGIGLAMSAMFVVQALLPFLSEGIRALLGARGVFLCFGLTSLVLASGFALAARGGKPIPARRPA